MKNLDRKPLCWIVKFYQINNSIHLLSHDFLRNRLAIFRKLIVILLSFLSVHAAAQVYKCTSNGKIIYQQSPCAGSKNGGELNIVVPLITGNSASSNLDELRNNYLQARKKADDLIAKHCSGKSIQTPSIGMSEADLMCLVRYRNPEKVNITTTGLGESKQYIYRDHNRATYIYFQGGKLTAIQGEQ
jgi:hypothetical protein